MMKPRLLLWSKKKYIQASESYARALQSKPNNTLARFNLGKSLAAAGKDPLISHQVFYYMGNSFFQLGKYAEAINAYNRALQRKSNYAEAQKALRNTKKLIEILNKQQPANR